VKDEGDRMIGAGCFCDGIRNPRCPADAHPLAWGSAPFIADAVRKLSVTLDASGFRTDVRSASKALKRITLAVHRRFPSYRTKARVLRYHQAQRIRRRHGRDRTD
jgi:hypothetical protein